MKNIPFAYIGKSGLKLWEDMKRPDENQRKYGYDLKPVITTYVSIGALRDIADEVKRYKAGNKMVTPSSSVWQGEPGFMSSFWVPRNASEKHGFCFRFATGSYQNLSSICFMDDVFEWAHRRKKQEEVRSGVDVVWQLAGYEGIVDNGKYWSWWNL